MYRESAAERADTELEVFAGELSCWRV